MLFVVRLVVHPGVRSDLLNCQPVSAVVGKELEHEVLERVTQRMAVHFRPVGVIPIIKKQAVEVLLLSGLLEGKDPLHDDEKDDGEGEDVDLGAHVSLALLDFRRHVGHRASVRLQRIDVLVASEAEVADFQVQFFVDQNIFQFQIAMNYALSVHVFDAIEKLTNKKSAGILAHGTHYLAEVEEQAARHVLHHNVDQIVDVATRGLDHFASIAVAEHRNQVLLVHVLQNSDLVMHREDRVIVPAQKLFFQNLDGDQFATLARPAHIDFRGVALSERLDNVVLSVEDGVRGSLSLLLLLLFYHLRVSVSVCMLVSCFSERFLFISIFIID